MSNSRVRKELESREKQSKLYEKYKAKEDLMLNYNTCRAYLKLGSCPIMGVVEAILKRKYNLPWQAKIVSKAIMPLRGERGVRNVVIEIPQFNYAEKVQDILSKFVKDHFNDILSKREFNADYPIFVRDLGHYI